MLVYRCRLCGAESPADPADPEAGARPMAEHVMTHPRDELLDLLEHGVTLTYVGTNQQVSEEVR